jgi:putative two-component system response regulator
VGEALEWLRRQPFDLMLCDICMPGPSGLDLARLARDRYPNVAMIMLTAVDDPAAGDAAISAGVFGYLIKPFRPNEVLVMIANALRRRKLELEHLDRQEMLEQLLEARTKELDQIVGSLGTTRKTLRQTREEVVHQLVKAARVRDVETTDHLYRMSAYCALIARRLGLPAERVEDIRLASMLHDVGKIGIPDAILRKPGRLTAEEFEVIKHHSEIGERMLAGSSSDLLDLAASIALTHHERFDGSGYPRGLAGEAIPLEGRIAALADVFDAMSTARVYKGAISVEKTLDYLLAERGGHFDPEIVDLFVGAMDEVLQIKAEQEEAGGREDEIDEVANITV